MELREDVDSASTDKELRPLLATCQNKQNELLSCLEEAFAKEEMDKAKLLTAKLRYWKRVEESILEKIVEV
jgi:DnaJ-domain-containing protein 1